MDWGFLASFLTCLLAVLGEKVVELHQSSYQQFRENNANSIVLYYVPWCHWCRKFLPQYEEIAIAAEHSLNGVTIEDKPVFAKLDVNQKENRQIMEAENIVAFPTLKMYSGQFSHIYNGEHTFKSVLRWVMEKTTSKLEIQTPDQLEAILKLHHSDVVAIFVNPTPGMETMYHSLSNANPDVMFGMARYESLSRYILETIDEAYPGEEGHLDRVAKLKANPKRPYLVLLNPHHFSDAADKFVYDMSHREYLMHIFPPDDASEHLLTNQTALDDFVKSYRFPTISRWSMPLASEIVEVGRPFLVAFRHLNDSMEEDQMYNAADGYEANDILLLHVEDVLWSVAQKFRSSMVTIVSGIDHFYERRLISTLGIEETPALVYVTMNPTGSGVFTPTLKFLAPKPIKDMLFTLNETEQVADATARAIQAVTNWVQNIKDDKIEPTIKSEELIPEDINQGPVRHIVGRTFETEVKKSKKDVVVDFYAPWCGHCRVLAPTYEKVAEAFALAGVKTIVFAKMDGTANEVPGLSLRGFPSIMIYPAKSKDSPVLHQGGIPNAEILIEVIASKVSHSVNVKRVLKALKTIEEGGGADIPKLLEEL